MLAAHASLVLALFWGVILVLWLERDGIRDQIDGHTSFIDLLYFAVVSLTTVGYGDIVPVTERSRLIDTVLITPARLVVWLVFIGTAFDLFLHKGLERLRMARLQQQLKDHVVICGFGHSGRTAATELVRRGTAADQIVVVMTAYATCGCARRPSRRRIRPCAPAASSPRDRIRRMRPWGSCP